LPQLISTVGHTVKDREPFLLSYNFSLTTQNIVVAFHINVEALEGYG
jgi:hypothetical protein